VLCDEHGIGGDCENCGDDDAQLDRINVLYHEAPGGKYVTRVVFFEPGVIGAARASPLVELWHHPHRFWVGFGVMCPPEHVWLG
jgi:hypothetical protein